MTILHSAVQEDKFSTLKDFTNAKKLISKLFEGTESVKLALKQLLATCDSDLDQKHVCI